MLDLLTFSNGLLAAAEGGEGQVGMSFAGLLVYTGITLAIIFGVLIAAKKGLKQRVFRNPWTALTEQLYLFIENMCVGTIGPHGRKYIPMIMTFWMVIFVGNLLSLFFPDAPTADVGFNLAMAFISIGYVQWEGIKANGFFGHLGHFAGPKLGIVLIPINGLIFVIEIISEALKNVSLSLRLYGNIHGGHMASDAMNQLGADYYIPIGAFLMPIKLLTVVVQALIFTLLTCVYLSLVTHHHEEHAEPGHHDEEEQAQGAKHAEALVH